MFNGRFTFDYGDHLLSGGPTQIALVDDDLWGLEHLERFATIDNTSTASNHVLVAF
jgi:hypothetical protein